MHTPTRHGRRNDGFTLLELLVVVAVIAFLTVIVSTTTMGASNVARAEFADAGPPVTYELTLAGQLLRLAGLALLLFGGGFWYMVELHSPGRLDRFRLGHFLLLALTYTLFFAVVAVLESNEVGSGFAVGIAAAVSYPLLALHAAKIVDLRFALTSVIPLAIVTTGVVVNGVYGGALRSLVYLGMACVVIAYLTLTHPGLQRGLARRCRELEQSFTDLVGELAPAAAASRAAIADGRALLALQDPGEHAALREWVEHRLDAARRTLDEHEQMIGEHDAMRSTTPHKARWAHRDLGTAMANRLRAQLPQACAALGEASKALAERRENRSRAAPSRPDVEHCIACGDECAIGARYCPGCGTPCATAVSCRRCSDVLRLPTHLLRAEADGEALVTHCLHCGERHAG